MDNVTAFLFLGGLGGTEVAVIIFVVLLLFGARRIPELARGLGQGLREFRTATTEVKEEVEELSELKNSSLTKDA